MYYRIRIVWGEKNTYIDWYEQLDKREVMHVSRLLLKDLKYMLSGDG